MKKNSKRIATIAVLITITTFIIYIINRFIAASACVKNILDKKIKYSYRWNFGKISYSRKGFGSPVLLIHDLLPGGSGYEWTRIENELSCEHTVYTIDLLGCGRSDKVFMTFTNFVYVQLIKDFVHNVIGENTDVISSGFSSSIVAMADRIDDTLFNKIIMVNPSPINMLKQMPSFRDRLFRFVIGLPVFGTLLYYIYVSRETITNLFIEKMFFDPFHPDENLIDACYEAAHYGGSFAKVVYSNKLTKFLNIDITEAVKSCSKPVLIISGETENNHQKNVEDYIGLNSAINNITIEGTKHFPHVERPQIFVNLIQDFLH